ncbi:sugar ABC transporter permease [Brevibacillus ruminantium]|uniref:Sugar ABC transporter permease n=1 Tax=Brevibacillus ruminantium TaxID=2950604 RepID=A0ABY4WIA6_9BACL|nr:sugar ABC transporter permease [Brevibacillus ruminantium]USG65074.1 sugar ABC transporter permease [Brevibacillus ruminantium]
MRKQHITPYIFIAPATVVFIVFYIYPLVYMGYLSFHSWNFIRAEKPFVGLENYISIFSDSMFYETVWNTLKYACITVALIVIIAIPLAIWINQKGRIFTATQGAVFSPHIISLVSVSMVWMWIMDVDYGLLNWVVSLFGIKSVGWLTNPNVAMYSLIFVSVWKNLGYYTLIIIAALQSIPKDLYEAAAIDKASKWRVFSKITFPMLTPTIFFISIIALINSIQVFETIDIMTGGGPINSTTTLVYYLYDEGFKHFHLGTASAAGMVLLFILMLLTILYFKVLSKRVHYQ